MTKLRVVMCVAVALFSMTVFAQSTPFYVLNGDSTTAYVLQNGALVNTFTTFSNAYPVAIGTTVRIGNRDDQTGAEYTLAGVPTGTTYTGNNAFSQMLDGTTDNVQYNYAIECCGATNSVVRTNLDWSGSQVLFNLPGGYDGAGIAYDPTTQHLFIGSLGESAIREFTLAGVQVNSFPTVAPASSLAYEASTDTLWFDPSGSSTIYQYSKSGTLLQSLTIPGYAPGNSYGGEFANAATPAPPVPTYSPLTLAVVGMLLAAVGMFAVKLRG